MRFFVREVDIRTAEDRVVYGELGDAQLLLQDIRNKVKAESTLVSPRSWKHDILEHLDNICRRAQLYVESEELSATTSKLEAKAQTLREDIIKYRQELQEIESLTDEAKYKIYIEIAKYIHGEKKT